MELNRRDFIAAAGVLGAVWFVGNDDERAAAGHHAHLQQSSQPPRLLFLSREQARELDAMTSRIIPTDETPGAHEAGVVYFIDHSVTTFAKDMQPTIVDGLKELATEAGKKFPGTVRFSALTGAQQDEVLKAMEKGKFFGAMRFATIAGMFALPTYGGNRNYIGWKLVGQDLQLDYQSPFGYYDQPQVLARMRRGENP
jgi:gluconate 2-dehydrogenase gamma chain